MSMFCYQCQETAKGKGCNGEIYVFVYEALATTLNDGLSPDELVALN